MKFGEINNSTISSISFNNGSSGGIAISPIPTCPFPIEELDIYPPIICSNSTQCEMEWPCELREYWHHLHPFILVTRGLNLYGTILTCILGIFLNGLSFYILTSSGLAKKGSGVYLIALAICDSLNLVFNYAVGVTRGEVEQFNQYFMDSVWLCRFHSVSVDVFQLISAWIVVSFTIERCIAIWYPMLLRVTQRYRSKAIVISLTVCLSLFSLSKLFVAGFEKDSVFGYRPCYSNAFIWQGMAYVRVAFQTWIPTVLVFIFNCLMFWKLRRIRVNRKRLTAYRHDSIERHRRNLQFNNNQGSFLLKPSSTTPMLIAVSLAYLVLVFPLGAVQTIELYWNIRKNCEFSEVEPQRSVYIQWMQEKLFLKILRSFFFGLYQINFAINFFLYCAAGVQFRVHLQFKLRQLYNSFRLEYYFPRNTENPSQNQNPSNTSSLTNITCPASAAAAAARLLPVNKNCKYASAQRSKQEQGQKQQQREQPPLSKNNGIVETSLHSRNISLSDVPE